MKILVFDHVSYQTCRHEQNKRNTRTIASFKYLQFINFFVILFTKCLINVVSSSSTNFAFTYCSDILPSKYAHIGIYEIRGYRNSLKCSKFALSLINDQSIQRLRKYDIDH